LDRLDDILIRHKRATTRWLAGFVFVALAIGLRSSIDQPPVWDGAMSVYPAAIELSRTDFDIGRLLSLPTYYEGGPNTHATSPWTMLVAVLIALTGSLESALPILHTISFGLAALVIAGTYRLIAHSAPGVVAVLGALAVLLFPPMLAQSSDIYLDLPSTCFATWTLVCLLERRFVAASVLTTLAIWIKPLAVVFAAVLVGFVLIYGDPRRRVLRAALLAVPPLIVAAIVSVANTAPSVKLPLGDRFATAINSTGEFLATVPDFLAISVIALALILASRRVGVAEETFRVMGLVLMAIFGFVLASPLVALGVPLLPRYYITFLPALMAGILTFLNSKSRLAAVAFASVIAVAFAVNINGAFYPHKEHPYFVLAERSLRYQDLLALQIEDMSVLTELSDDMPVFYDYFTFYRLEYPEMGYSEGPLASGVSLFHTPELADASLADMPAHFAFVFEYPVLGGDVLLRVWDEAKASGAQVTETTLTRGSFTVYVVEVDQSESPSP
jgi:hypothetical protein